jgi:TonB family protein
MSETEEQLGLLERVKLFAGENRAVVITGGVALVLALALFWSLLNTASLPKEKQAPPPIQVQIVRPKPPPPPPPPPKIPQEKLITPPKQVTPVQKTFTPHTPPKPQAAKPPGPAQQQTSIHNDTSSSDFAGLAEGSGDGSVGGTGGGGGSYEGAVAADIEAALAQNPQTRNANAGLQVRIWLSATGTVTQVEIDKSSGDPQVDAAVKNQVLAGLQLPAPPPGTGMPIIMSLTGQQPL